MNHPLFSLVFVLFCVCCDCVRVKHSEYTDTWRSPDDSTADWPSPDQVYFDLGESIEGDVVLPGGWDYRNGSVMMNYRYQSKLGAVVYPESTKDVQRTMFFAQQHGIRPTVYSTGHDFLGRSARDHTLNINLRRMKQMDLDFNDSRSDTNMTITVGTGKVWAELYAEVDKYGVIVLGGASPLVSPGGYTLGGGHSPYTRMKGLGVDQVVAFTMVTANASIIRMEQDGGTMENPDGSIVDVTDPDLWWAVLGGGGGVYGVVTQFVLKLYPAPDGFVQYISYWPITSTGNCQGVATGAMELFLDLVRTNLTNNWGGYYVLSREVGGSTIMGNLLFSLNHWGRDEQEATSVIAELMNYRTDCQEISFVGVFDTFWEMWITNDDTLWARQHLIGTLLQEEDLLPSSGAAQMIIDIVNATEISDDINVACTATLIGGNARNLPQDVNSVSPDFRNGLVSHICGTGWFGPSNDERYTEALIAYGNNHLYQYGTGAYYNENDYYLQNWQVEFWGSMERYERLLAVKQRWDPDNVFWCHHCVGSEFV